MYIDFRKKRNEKRVSFRLFGVVSCKACAEKWKQTLMKKGKKVRMTNRSGKWEVWAT